MKKILSPSVAAALAIAMIVVGIVLASTPAHHAPGPTRIPVRIVPTSTTPTHADWLLIEGAAGSRRLALAPHRTPYYRSFAAYMGLDGLMRLHPLKRGKCTTAVSYLYNNLTDLHLAPAAAWRRLPRLIQTQPSLSACRPRATVTTRYTG